MPVRHYYECAKGHITEHSLDSYQSKVRCGKEITTGKSTRLCQSLAEVLHISDRKGQNALAFKPIEFFINSEGEVVNLGCSLNDLGKLSLKSQNKMKKYIRRLEKKGFTHKSLSTIFEYEAFRKEHNSRLTEANLEEIFKHDIASSEYIREEINDLKRGFTLNYPDGRSVAIPPLDKFDHPEARKLAEDLMNDRPLDLDILREMPDGLMKQELMEINSYRSNNPDAGFHIKALEDHQGKRTTWF